MVDFNVFNPNIQFTHESSEKSIAFLDLDVALRNGRLESTINVKPSDRDQYLHYSASLFIQSIKKGLFYLAELYLSVERARVKRTFEIISSK